MSVSTRGGQGVGCRSYRCVPHLPLMAFHKLTCGWDKAVGYCIALHWKLGTEGIDPNDKFEINLARHLYIACIHLHSISGWFLLERVLKRKLIECHFLCKVSLDSFYIHVGKTLYE